MKADGVIPKVSNLIHIGLLLSNLSVVAKSQ